MRLNNKDLQDKRPWEKAGILLPRFDRGTMIRTTRESPRWVHFGAGNIFRAFPAALQQILLDRGIENTGIIAVEGYDGEIIDKVFRPCANATLAVTLKSDGTIEKRVIASVAQALRLDSHKDFDILRGIFRSPSLQMVSFTITEKGYSLSDCKNPPPDAEADFINGPENPQSYLGCLAGLCYERYRAGKFPLALVSMDNCFHNGDKLFQCVESFVIHWREKDLVEPGFLDYIRDPSRVSFPRTMIDKITPRPDEAVGKMLEALGFTDTAVQITAKNTYVAPFVNAEETQYLVIEDVFPAGRPALEAAGVLFTGRDTVDRAEKMKVCTCLNPLHTALAIFGCLLGYTRISATMKDWDLVRLVEIIGYTEGLPVAADPGVLSPKQFIDQVLQVRFPNPFIPDTPQRIATDTSRKLSVRFGETIKAYLTDPARNIGDLKCIPLVLAAWVRYLMGIDDQGAPFTVSPDPLYDILCPALSGIRLGQKGPFHRQLEPILSNSGIFGFDLYGSGCGELVETYFEELTSGPGAVRSTLKRLTGNPLPSPIPTIK
ncbi:MAG: mannitol dehydrogenase family protein [Spirochaetaceae bacterium]|jgi:fructuronate reductase|nr:mannitol dehydrogenase family protein [Spirochaetaceae bacterium]